MKERPKHAFSHIFRVILRISADSRLLGLRWLTVVPPFSRVAASSSECEAVALRLSRDTE
ncbi:MAG: hypothetical protein VX884_00275 [Pseudomonadota bacterium]|nr:hypothetical protein [Pseudomonadota bacterium]